MEKYKTKEESYKVYEEYVKAHIKNIRIVSFLYSQFIYNYIFPDFDYEEIKNEFILDILSHDLSKYSQEEFGAYAAKFRPYEENKDTQEKIDSDFELAWEHHYKLNKHHPEFWSINISDSAVKIDMPKIYILEMICDWITVSMTLNGSLYEWWNDKGRNEISIYLKDDIIKDINEFISDNKSLFEYNRNNILV